MNCRIVRAHAAHVDALCAIERKAVQLFRGHPAWPAYAAQQVPPELLLRDVERGLVLGGSGQGEQIAANKVEGIRAALCNDLYTARMAREHNDANVLSMGGRIVAPGLADEIVVCFLQTPYQGGRHNRRVDQLGEIGRRGADGDALDLYLDSLVPGITARAQGKTQGAST